MQLGEVVLVGADVVWWLFGHSSSVPDAPSSRALWLPAPPRADRHVREVAASPGLRLTRDGRDVAFSFPAVAGLAVALSWQWLIAPHQVPSLSGTRLSA